MGERQFVAGQGAGLQIRWEDGHVEVFPEDLFAEECRDRPCKIRLYRRQEYVCDEEFSLTVEGVEALLDFAGRFARRNSAPARNIEIGQTRIRFADETRVTVREVGWRYPGHTEFRR